MMRILPVFLLLMSAACAGGGPVSLYAGPAVQDKKADPKKDAENKEKPADKKAQDGKEGKEGKEKGEPLEAVIESVKGIVDVKRPRS